MDAAPLLAAWTDHAPLGLVVDIDIDTRKLHAEYLKLSGFAIEEAEDGREALAKAISFKPDVILTEVRLPGITGIDLCELLRRDSATCKIPIVFITSDAHQVGRAQAVGANAVLMKPCDPESVLAVLCRVLDQAAGVKALSRFVREAVSREHHSPKEAAEGDRSTYHRIILSRNYARLETVDPPAQPPALVCPTCDMPLQYQRSHVGGVSARHPEQWDYFDCENGCGTFQYRQRTRKLRKL